MKKKTLLTLIALATVALVTACVAPPPAVDDAIQPADASPAVIAGNGDVTGAEPAEALPAAETTTAAPARRGMGAGGMGMGGMRAGMNGMMERHQAPIPDAYASLQNPIPADSDSLLRGQALYTANCLTCHGETGMGDGPTGAALDPSPAPIARTSQMLSDGYLFWRITEGGSQFGTAMPVWGATLEPRERWDVINFVQNIGAEAVRGNGPGPGPRAGEGEHRAEMLAAAVEQGAITADDVVVFEKVHAVLDEHYMQSGAAMENMEAGGMMAMQSALLGQAVRDGYITQADADRFTAIHDTLMEMNMMQ